MAEVVSEKDNTRSAVGVESVGDVKTSILADEIEKFENMGLKSELLKGIFGYGFDTPSSIQKRGIMPIIRGRDTIGQAQSGTGKTATFVIGCLQLLDENISALQVLILGPTRELAQQIQNVVQSLGEPMRVKCHACVGGTAVREDINALKDGVHIVVGTPGRVMDMLRRGDLIAKQCRILVLDEADEMLGKGFAHQIHTIFQFLPPNIQVALFSATMPGEIDKITECFMREPFRICVNKEQLTLEGIRQYYVSCETEPDKVGVIIDLYETIHISQSIIYCSSRKRVQELTESLHKEQHTVASIHGDMSQQEREAIIKEFRSGTSRILITTDLLARGIDIQGVSLVINFDLPNNKEAYIHRIGRSGRYGRKGCAINLVLDEQMDCIKELQEYYGTQIDPLPEDFGNDVKAGQK